MTNPQRETETERTITRRATLIATAGLITGSVASSPASAATSVPLTGSAELTTRTGSPSGVTIRAKGRMIHKDEARVSGGLSVVDGKGGGAIGGSTRSSSGEFYGWVRPELPDGERRMVGVWLTFTDDGELVSARSLL